LLYLLERDDALFCFFLLACYCLAACSLLFCFAAAGCPLLLVALFRTSSLVFWGSGAAPTPPTRRGWRISNVYYCTVIPYSTKHSSANRTLVHSYYSILACEQACYAPISTISCSFSSSSDLVPAIGKARINYGASPVLSCAAVLFQQLLRDRHRVADRVGRELQGRVFEPSSLRIRRPL